MPAEQRTTGFFKGIYLAGIVAFFKKDANKGYEVIDQMG